MQLDAVSGSVKLPFFLMVLEFAFLHLSLWNGVVLEKIKGERRFVRKRPINMMNVIKKNWLHSVQHFATC